MQLHPPGRSINYQIKLVFDCRRPVDSERVWFNCQAKGMMVITLMKGNIKKYLDLLAGSLPSEIISADTYNRIYRLATSFADFVSSEYIMESHLDEAPARVDFSFRVLAEEKDCLVNGLKKHPFTTPGAGEAWRKVAGFVNFWPMVIDDIWVEMDYGQYGKQVPRPCFFFNAGRVKNGAVVDERLLFNGLKQLLDGEQLARLWSQLIRVIKELPPEVGLFQIGVMLARNSDRVRVFTDELTRAQVGQYLSACGWIGDFSVLERLFALVHAFSDGWYILDFDLGRQGMCEKIGINFGLDKKESLPAFLEGLVEHGLCTAAKKRGVSAWSGSKGGYLGPDYGYTALIRDISHFKISCVPEAGLKAKAYLRVEGIYLKELGKNRVVTQAPVGQEVRLGYREMQNVFKEIAKRSMLDKDYRALCLRDSRAAIQQVIKDGAVVPGNIVFLEEDGAVWAERGSAYVLPPFLQKSWLTSK